MPNKDLIIQIKSQYQNAGIDELRTALKSVVGEMNNMKKAGDVGSQSWNDLKTKAGVLTKEISGLGREFRGLEKDTKLSTLGLLEMGENLTVVILGFKQAITGIKNTGSELIKAANDLQSATIGLETISKFKGVEPDVAVNSVKSLDLVKNGLMTVGEASMALKNLLSSGFSLEESITLMKRFGDSASFNRQSSLEFGYAIVSATEGIKNQNSVLVDNAGVTKNLSVILREQGYSEKDLQNIQSDGNVRTALYNGLLKETQGQLGDADKYTKTFAGSQAKLNAQILTLKQNFGLMLEQALKPLLDKLVEMPPAVQAVAFALGTVVTTGIDLIPVLAQLKIAFPELANTMRSSFNGLGLIIAGELFLIIAAITAVMILVKEVNDQADRQKQYKKDRAEEEKVNANELYNKPTLKEQNNTNWNSADTEFDPVTGKRMSGTTTTGETISVVRDEARKKDDENLKKAKELVDNIGKNTKDTKGSGSSGSNGLNNVKEDLDDIQKLNKNIIDLQKEINELTSNYGAESRIVLQHNEELYKVTKERDNLISKPMGLKPITLISDIINKEDETKERTGYKKTDDKTAKEFAALQTRLNIMSDTVPSLANAFGGLFGAIASGAGSSADAFKSFLKNIVNTFITSIQAMLLAANAALVAKGITTFGLSLITDAPLLAAGWIALEAAKGMIGSFATGGRVSGAGTGTSDSILARISNGEFVVNAKATSNNLGLLQAINGNTNRNIMKYANGGQVNRNVNNNNVYVGSNIDGVQFFKINEPKYRAYKYSKRV